MQKDLAVCSASLSQPERCRNCDFVLVCGIRLGSLLVVKLSDNTALQCMCKRQTSRLASFVVTIPHSFNFFQGLAFGLRDSGIYRPQCHNPYPSKYKIRGSKPSLVLKGRQDEAHLKKQPTSSCSRHTTKLAALM